jgi:hypothetical protein
MGLLVQRTAILSGFYFLIHIGRQTGNCFNKRKNPKLYSSTRIELRGKSEAFVQNVTMCISSANNAGIKEYRGRNLENGRGISP